MPVVSAELLLMLMPLAAVIAILLGWQQQRLADARRDSLDTHRAILTLEAAFAHVPVGLAVLDLDLRFMRINRQLAEINGLPAEDHIGKSIHDVIPDIAPAAEVRIRQVMARSAPLLGFVFEGATPAQAHVRRVWRESIYPVVDRNGAMLGVTVVVEEITEQQRLAGALKDSQRREQRRTNELEGLMKAAPAALFVASDRECRRIKANPAAERLLRLRRGENPAADAPGHRAFAVYAGGTLLALDQLPLQRAAATGEEVRDEPLTVRFADDERLHVVINALPLRDEAGEVVGAVAGFVEAPAATANAEIDG
ncbi:MULTISPECIES: PAS domain-containing protein [Massilia]|uniref:PAS domain-containing protein n=2 Tax=Massilia TaxID=149698 RepID=A0A7X3KBF0_9BURK|nr:PAS domain-containing protein [Massilia sp. YIM B02787]MVW64006.1 PAS domain-containing protein [Telluria cellulosilytica]